MAAKQSTGVSFTQAAARDSRGTESATAAPAVVTANEFPPSTPDDPATGKSSSKPLAFIPGSEVLGRGVYIRPRQPYELKDYVLEREIEHARKQQVFNGSQPYLVPQDCEVNDSPPLPSDRATGQTIIEESWFRFGREVTTTVHAAANAKIVSIDATSFQGHSLKMQEDSYYALRSSFIPFWSVYMPRTEGKNAVAEFLKLDKTQKSKVGQAGDKERVPPSNSAEPSGGQADALFMPDGPFDPMRRADYARIFERFGTHYVSSAWVGGKASLTFVVSKSSKMSKEDVKAGIEATFSGVAGGGTSESRTRTQEQVRNNSTCNVFGSGGDPTELAKLTTLEASQYNNWITSVKQNPEIIELGVAGIWTLLSDPEKKEALRQAYREESTFTPLTAVVPFRDWLVFLKGDQAFDYALTSKYSPWRLHTLSSLFKPTEIRDPEALRVKIESLVRGTEVPRLTTRFIQAATRALPSSPAMLGLGMAMKELAPDAVGTPNETTEPAADLADLTAQLNVLVLSGSQFLELRQIKETLDKIPQRDRFCFQGPVLNRLLLEKLFPNELVPRSARTTLATYLPVLENYPDFMQPHAAFSLASFGPKWTDKLYLVRWRQCLRIDLKDGSVDKGYPKNMAEDWPGLAFDRLDAAVAFAPNRVYFFWGSEYVRYDLKAGGFVMTTRDQIKNRWPGVMFDSIDTAAYWGSNKIYFFSGDEYTRYDFATHRTDPGYPKFLSSNYVEDWEIFE